MSRHPRRLANVPEVRLGKPCVTREQQWHSRIWGTLPLNGSMRNTQLAIDTYRSNPLQAYNVCPRLAYHRCQDSATKSIVTKGSLCGMGVRWAANGSTISP